VLFGKSLTLSGALLVLGLATLGESAKTVAQTPNQNTADESRADAGKRSGAINLREVPLIFGEATADPRLASRYDTAVEATSRSYEVPAALPPRKRDKLTQLEKAYLDAFTILSQDNLCSRVYGGPRSIAALNELAKQLRPTYLGREMAIRMRGPTTTIRDGATGFTFRRFDKAEINLGGPFYRGNTLYDLHLPSIGGFPPNTREARVTVLLHELGHLVKGPDKQWVLPDDGHDPNLSRDNTYRVVVACGKQIESVTRLSSSQELQRAEGEVQQYESETLNAGP
jgi:hypothetical protein